MEAFIFLLLSLITACKPIHISLRIIALLLIVLILIKCYKWRIDKDEYDEEI